MALTLYTNTQSRGVVVDWLILDLGIAVERKEIAYGTEMKSPEFLNINPFGKVPVLVDGDVVVYELDAICAYLADKFFDKGLAPALDDPKRGLYYRWLFFAAGPFAAASDNQHLQVNVTAEQKMFMGYGDYADTYQALVKGLSQASPYLCGEQFTAADISLGAMLMWQLKMGYLKSHPAIERYVEAIQQRESFQKNSTLFG
ncbi:glutathione S-transferase family protein [Acinetobacter sp. Marseille-Q1618]|uniref:glutathione S-transferase family protein n=1 Tax=Acinetobacter sp. Marseille-Q1618 TaxID=2697502 RepID=UPI00156F4682|nr:glutathione S-transferase family protein [Acinetobacter sp. Marseille-Q1618]